MKINNFDQESEFMAIPTLEKAAELSETEHTHVIMMVLNLDDYIKKLAVGMNGSFFLVETTLDFEKGDEAQKITAATMEEGDKVSLYSFKINSNLKARILIIKHLTTS